MSILSKNVSTITFEDDDNHNEIEGTVIYNWKSKNPNARKLIKNGKKYKATKVKSVVELKKFEETAVAKDKIGKNLLNGRSNSMIALFMAMFAQECYPKFNEVSQQHFK